MLGSTLILQNVQTDDYTSGIGVPPGFGGGNATTCVARDTAKPKQYRDYQQYNSVVCRS